MSSDAATLARTGRLSLRAKLGLAREILPTYLRLRSTLRRNNLPAALALARGNEAGPVGDPHEPLAYAPARRLGRAVERTLAPIPASSRCLMTSLVLVELLARRGTSSSLVIGVSPGSSFGAHAWVELEGRPLLPPNGETFQRLAEL